MMDEIEQTPTEAPEPSRLALQQAVNAAITEYHGAEMMAGRVSSVLFTASLSGQQGIVPPAHRAAQQRIYDLAFRLREEYRAYVALCAEQIATAQRALQAADKTATVEEES